MTKPSRSGRVTPITHCTPCGKQCYPSRAQARRAASQIRARVGRLNAYPCPHSDYWHLGHLPPDITAGHRDRSTL